MRWARYAAVFSLLALRLIAADEYVRVTMEDGGTLKIPNRLFHQVEVVKDDARGGVLIGLSEDRQMLFAYTRLNKRSGESPLFDALSQTMLMTALERRGAVRPSFNAVSALIEGTDQASLYRIDDPKGPFHDQLIFLDSRTDRLGMGIFILIGPSPTFSSYVPMLNQMMQSYTLEVTRIDSSSTVANLLGAILVLLLNLAFVWFGFNRLSHMRHLGLTEQG